MTEIKTDSELNAAAEAFFQAAYEYIDVLKRHSPKDYGGVTWVRRGSEMIAYSHMGRYTRQLCEMTYDTAKDELVFTDAVHPDDEEGDKK